MDEPFGGWDEQAEDVEAAAEAASIIEAAEVAWGGNFISWEGYGHPPIFEKLGKVLMQLENRDQTTHGSYRWIIMLEKCGHANINVFHLKWMVLIHKNWKSVGRFLI